MADLGQFVHLHVHSHYSLLDGANRLQNMVKRAEEQGMRALALTDHGNLFGAYQFQKACDGSQVKPLIGCEIYLSPTAMTDKASPQARTRYHFLLLCQNLEGYRNLSRMVSLGYLEGFYYKPRIDYALLEKHAKGLIATSACIQSPIAMAIRNGNMAEAQRQVDAFAQIFGKGNFFIEIMDHGLPDQKKVNDGLLELARKNGLPLVATNDCHYLEPAGYDAHDVMLCIQTGKKLDDPGRLRFDVNEFYVKSPDEMIAKFGHLDGAIANTVEVAERCDCVIPTKQKLLPKFHPPEGLDSPAYLRKLVAEGLVRRYGERLGAEQRDRAEMELDVIEKMGFVDYFLVVWDFIHWAKGHGIPVGPGRGSGAGSIVAYCLAITDLDPLPNGLLFERFLNPERVSMPDFDIDFCFERRGEVIDYVQQKYGKDCVAQIITFGTMKAKNAIRDVGRVMDLPLSEVDQIAKLVPGDPKATLEKALNEVAELRERYDNDPTVRDLIDRARGIEGLIRQPSTHAAGIVICDRPLIDIVPLFRQPGEDSMMATQYAMTEVEEIGLLKMDFLGLKNLTLIDRCIKCVNRRQGLAMKAEDIPLEDPETYKLLQAGRGLGVFQLESRGMRDLLESFLPARFSDLVALISLYRPGPMDNIPSFIKRKDGKEPIVYDHPCLEPILKETHGLFVYQEQVMQVAQVMGGYTLGGADVLRRAMSKKKAKEMAKQRQAFLAGAAKNGIAAEVASRVFDTMEKFAEYGFNKSHAAAYAVVTVQTAWLKARHPIDFYAALMSMEIGGDDKKLASYFEEAAEQGIKILAPDANTSDVHFTPVGGDIRFGLSAIKGVGEAAVEAILAERDGERGAFKSLQDFVARCDKKHVNARVVECLVKCGAFDSMGHNRPSLLDALPKIMELAGTSSSAAADKAQGSLFDAMSAEDAGGLRAEIPIPRLRDWTDKLRLETERELVGFYLSGHPLDRFEPDFAAFSTATAAQATTMHKGEDIEWVGLVKRLVPRADKNGRMFAFAECEDKTGPIELTFFADAFAASREFLREGEVIWVKGRIDNWRDANKIRVAKAASIDAVREERIRAIDLTLAWQQVTEASIARLRQLVAQHPGRRKLWVTLQENGAEARVEAGNGHGIAPTAALIRELQSLEGARKLRLVAKP
jgi:DNA polymerase-3 subunit alpha